MPFLPDIDTGRTLSPYRRVRTPLTTRPQRPKTSVVTADGHSPQRARTSRSARAPALTPRTPRSGRRPGTSNRPQQQRLPDNKLIGSSHDDTWNTDSDSFSSEEEHVTPRDVKPEAVANPKDGVIVTRTYRPGLPQRNYDYIKKAPLKKRQTKPDDSSDFKLPAITKEQRDVIEESKEKQEKLSHYKRIIDEKDNPTISNKLPKLYNKIKNNGYTRFKLNMRDSKNIHSTKTSASVEKVNINAATIARFNMIGGFKKSQTQRTIWERMKDKTMAMRKVTTMKNAKQRFGYQNVHSKEDTRLSGSANTEASGTNNNPGDRKSVEMLPSAERGKPNRHEPSRGPHHAQRSHREETQRKTSLRDTSDVIKQATQVLANKRRRDLNHFQQQTVPHQHRDIGLQPKASPQNSTPVSVEKELETPVKSNNKTVTFVPTCKKTEEPTASKSQIQAAAVKAVEEKFNRIEEKIVQPIESRFEMLERKVSKHRQHLDRDTKQVLRGLETTMRSVKEIENKFSEIEKRFENVDILEETLDKLETKFTEMKPTELENKIALVEQKLSRMNEQFARFKRQFSSTSELVPKETYYPVNAPCTETKKPSETISDKDLRIIQKEFHDLKYNMDPEEVIDIMFAAEILSRPQKQELKAMRRDCEKAEYLIDLVSKGTYEHINVLKKALIDTKQEHLSRPLP